MSYRRYYITPTRLTKNPYLWRSIGLMTTLKPNQEIHLPEATMYWLRNGSPANWTTISPENVALCYERYGYSYEPDWKTDIPRAQKVMDLLLVSKFHDKRNIPLSSSITKEESITKFLEGEFTDLLTKFRTTSTDGSWRSVPDLAMLQNWTNYILSNRNLKQYQIEFLWSAWRANTEIAKNLLQRVPIETLPDYIVQHMIDNIVSYEDKYDRDHHLYKLMQEGIKRGMVAYTKPVAITVPPQPRPTTFVLPVTEEVKVVPS